MSDIPGNGLRRGRPPGGRLDHLSPRPMGPQDEGGPRDEAHPREERLTRMSRKVDRFYIDPRKIPDGWSYEWKREAIYGQPDPDHQVNMAANHWRAVDVTRHPELMPPNWTGAIRKDGLVLMERPDYLTEDARAEDYDIAMSQVARREREYAETPVGDFPRDHPSARRVTGIRKSFERPMVAED